MNPLLSQALTELVRAVAKEVVSNIFKGKDVPADIAAQFAANDPNVETPNSTTAEQVKGGTVKESEAKEETKSVDLPPEELRKECLSLINLYAPTQGPAIRKALANVGAKRLSEVQADDLGAVYEALQVLTNA